ncbi:putative ribonuclease H-like domain-containing protein [Tanacetum coccineum]
MKSVLLLLLGFTIFTPKSQTVGDPKEEPKKISEALQDDSWVQAMQEELLQFKLQQVVKALYGLHQAPRAWYATLSTFLEKHGYKRGTIDNTLFIKRDKKDIMLVQVYVDDIIFGSTKKSWCDEFEALMKSRFQMSSMAEILKKFDLVNVKTAITPMETKVALTKDEEAVDVDVHLYRSMIGNPQQVVVNFLDKRPYLMAMQETDHSGYFYN